MGHKAIIREVPLHRNGAFMTHDWEFYIKGISGEIDNFVENVTYRLHPSFPEPHVRVVKEPPYILRESGYAGFLLDFEIHFKNNDEPRKAIFQYDLYLQANGLPPINPSRKVKLIFNFPSNEFFKKLFKGGGSISRETVPKPNKVVPNKTVYKAEPKKEVVAERKSRSSSSKAKKSNDSTVAKIKVSSKSSTVPIKLPSLTKVKRDEAFRMIFGDPIIRVSKKDQAKSHEKVTVSKEMAVDNKNKTVQFSRKLDSQLSDHKENCNKHKDSSRESSMVVNSTSDVHTVNNNVNSDATYSSNQANSVSIHVTRDESLSYATIVDSITSEMKLLTDLHDKICSLDNPDKLLEIVNIINDCGIDCWSVDSEVSFNFDLCKLKPQTIQMLMDVITSS